MKKEIYCNLNLEAEQNIPMFIKERYLCDWKVENTLLAKKLCDSSF